MVVWCICIRNFGVNKDLKQKPWDKPQLSQNKAYKTNMQKGYKTNKEILLFQLLLFLSSTELILRSCLLYWNIKYNFWPSNKKGKKILLTGMWQKYSAVRTWKQLLNKRSPNSPNSNILYFVYIKFKTQIYGKWQICQRWGIKYPKGFALKISKATASCDLP